MDTILLKEFAKVSNRYSVLFVEDDDTVRLGIKTILDQFFAKVYTACNGLEGLKSFEKNNPSLVISDITMPIMDGLEMSSKIKDINPTQKIIISSAHQDNDLILNSIEIGVDGYILKPIQKNQFLSVIKKVVDQLNIEEINKEYQEKLEIMVEQQVDKIIQQSEMMLKHLKSDSLTGLGNKKELEIDFKEYKPKYMLFINLDNFNQINVSYGFDSGDILLKEVADFIDKYTDDNRVYRIGGDDFCINYHHDNVLEFSSDLKKSIYDKVFLVNKVSMRISVTIGILEVDDNYKDVPYSNGYLVVKSAKESRKNSIALFENDLSLYKKQKECLDWSQKVKKALDEDMIVPFFQPITNLKTNTIDKYECLARIKDDDKYISPYFFIGPAKIAGILPQLTRMIIEKSFKMMQNSDASFSLNITDDDLKEEYLDIFLEKMCQKYNISSNRVVLEVLENISNYDTQDAISQLENFKSKGFKISIDDFGAESSNFERVQKLNVDYIKIDGSFIKDIDTDANSLNIVKTIIYYAKLSDIKVIAEYVHNQAVLDILRELDVDYVQGYHLGEPKPNLVEKI